MLLFTYTFFCSLYFFTFTYFFSLFHLTSFSSLFHFTFTLFSSSLYFFHFIVYFTRTPQFPFIIKYELSSIFRDRSHYSMEYSPILNFLLVLYCFLSAILLLLLVSSVLFTHFISLYRFTFTCFIVPFYSYFVQFIIPFYLYSFLFIVPTTQLGIPS